MSNFVIYTPQSIMMPREFSERHAERLKYTIHHYDDEIRPDLDYVLIHDVWRSRDGNYIIAMDSGWRHWIDFPYSVQDVPTPKIKPDWDPIKRELFPLKIYHNGQPLKYKYHCYPRWLRQPLPGRFLAPSHLPFGIYKISLSNKMKALHEIELEFAWRNFKRTIQVPPNPFVSAKNISFTLHTLQKDNPVEWIEDWIHYYHREHRVERVVIYDNDSENQGALLNCLKNIRNHVELVLIPWPYNYKMYWNLCQMTSLNHCPLIWGDSSKYYLNFDIDEYLVNPSDYSLKEYLSNYTKTNPASSSITIPDCRVPYKVGDSNQEQLPRVGDFQYISKRFLKTEVGFCETKTVNIYDKFSLLEIHLTLSHLHCISVIFNFIRQLKYKIYQQIKKVENKLGLPSHSITPRQKVTEVRSWTKLYMNHYQGLKTGWKYKVKRLTELDMDKYTLDPIMPGKLRKHGLMRDADKIE